MAQTMKGLREEMPTTAGANLQANGFIGHCHYHQPTSNHYNHLNHSGSSYTSSDWRHDGPNGDSHVTVLKIDQKQQQQNDPSGQQNLGPFQSQENGHLRESMQNGGESDFVTVLTIASSTAPLMTSSSMSNRCCPVVSTHPTLSTPSSSTQKVFVDNRRGEIEEEVTIYRLPGERLGMALRFDGGQSVCQTIRRVFVQSISTNSPASKAIGLMLGILREGDEILQIDGRHSCTLTRHECISLLRDAPVCIRLLVRRCPPGPCLCCPPYLVPNGVHAESSSCCQTGSTPNGLFEQELVQPPLNGLSVSSVSSAVFVSSSESPLSSNLSDLQSGKKVPPPVPPRMATTTLSIKRKPKPIPVPPESPAVASVSVSEGVLELMPPIEKPPRRKNQTQVGNPPPLPPRRPKGPPPKPPTERTLLEFCSAVTAASVTSSCCSITTTSTKSVPSLVTVITTKVCDVISTSQCQQSLAPTSTSTNLVALAITASTSSESSSSCKSSHIKTSATSKVTFTISNSKVSSFIRQTAEKLHRKLSGKSTSPDETDDSKHGHKSSQALLSSVETTNSIKINVSKEAKLPVEVYEQSEICLTSDSPSKSESFSVSESSAVDLAVPTAAIYMDSCQDIDANSVIESDTDDTSSSVSTIIERSSINSVLFNDTLMPNFEHSPYFAHRNIRPEHEYDSYSNRYMPAISPQTVSMVNRVLSPFERLEREFDNETQNGPFSLSCLSNTLALTVPDKEHTFRSLSLLPNRSINHDRDEPVQLSPNKTSALITDDQLPVASKHHQCPSSVVALSEDNCQTKSPSSIPVDTDSQRDYENVQVLPEKPSVAAGSFTEDSLLLEPPKEFASASNITAESNKSLNKTDNESITNQDASNGKVDNNATSALAQLGVLPIDEEDEEDFDVMKNDIISRVDDDKDDFMLDTNYLNESSARYLFHHSGSELILAPYSELSSITEEDEEDEICTNLDSKQAPLTDNLQIDAQPSGTMLCVDIEQTNGGVIAHDVKEESQPMESECAILNGFDGDTNLGEIDEPDNGKHSDDSDIDQRSDSSSSSSQKVSLNNVFDFLNEAADDFEFVERMLELTNDKIDSIDDIMRIRESLRGLQQSEQRGNLQRFLDGKDVIDELMALSSPTHSAASSLEAECQMSDGAENELTGAAQHATKQVHAQTMGRLHSKPLSAANDDVSDEFTSLPVCLPNSNNDQHQVSNGDHRMGAHPLLLLADHCSPLYKDSCDPRVLSNGNLSKIPTLGPKPVLGTLAKRSQSVSNIFNRSNGFNSLIELRPSLIPRPISNFNLALPESNISTKSSQVNSNSNRGVGNNGHVYSHHNCLNRSTSMQSIPSNSLSRSSGKSNKNFARRSSGTGSNMSQWSGGNTGSTNYHHNCLRNQDSNPPYYGSLSRSVSKSTANVFSTGSLPRPNKPHVPSKLYNSNNQSGPSGYCNGNTSMRTSSLIDLTYGLAPNKFRSVPVNPAPCHSSRRHSSSNLYLCDSTPPKEDTVPYLQCSTQVSQNATVKPSKSSLRSSSSLISLPSSAGSSHFWHCSHHTSSTSPPSSIGKSKRTPNNGSSGKSGRPNPGQAQSSSKLGKSLNRKPSKSLSCTSSSASSSKSESDDQQQISPQTRSILRHSSISKHRSLLFSGDRHQQGASGPEAKQLDYWGQGADHRQRRNFELSSHSDSENSDITISSGDSGDCVRPTPGKGWQAKRRNSHKVCFVDEVVQHPTITGTTGDINYCSSAMEGLPVGGKKQVSAKASLHHNQCNEERFDSSSPEMPVLSSSTSTSSISSLSSGELAKMCSSRLRPKEQTKQNSNGNLPKSIFLVVSSQREDSGIFASDDTSTSEFSQSPSPDLLMGPGTDAKIHQEDLLDAHSVKERIAFFDPVTNKALDLNRSLSCHKSNNSTALPLSSASGPLLSRSCSAPYETHCELGAKLSEQGEDILLTPPQSPPNEPCKESQTSVPSTVSYLGMEAHLSGSRTETTAYPVTIEYKKPSPFSLRDSMITARRYQNTCKLKGLVIPDTSSTPTKDGLGDSISLNSHSRTQNTIELPTIISEDTLKVTSSKDFINEFSNPLISNRLEHEPTNLSAGPDSEKPIEILALKATTMNVPKYSPMFKRRPFSLPLNPDISYGAPKQTPVQQSNQSIQGNNMKTTPPPAVPPKPRVSLPAVRLEENPTISAVIEPPSKVLPPLPPKRKDIKLDFLDEDQTSTSVVQHSESMSNDGQVHEQLNKTQTVSYVEEAIRPNITAAVDSSLSSEFVIHQKQYSMRAIVFELIDQEDCDEMGIELTGGLDSINKEVTVQNITPNSLASRDGRLQKGDRIVSVNGKLLLGLTHEETVDLLQSACRSQRVMIVSSRPHEHNTSEMITPTVASVTSPSILESMSFTATAPLLVSPMSGQPQQPSNGVDPGNYKIVKAEITKDVTGLGFIIEGGKNSSLGDRPITIKRIFRGGPLDKEGSLLEGDELLTVNEQSMQEMTRAEAWNFLKQLPDGKVTLVTRRKRYF